MSRPARPWFRFYVEAFADRKLLRLTPAQRWLWVAVLGAARESCEPGVLLIAPGVPMTHYELARYADVREKDIAPALEVMKTLGMVTQTNDVVSVTNWDHRQFESDDTAKRTAKHRSKERSHEQSNDVPGNTPETETEAETDREARKRATLPTLPTSLAVDDSLRAWGAEKVPGVNLDAELEGWLLWCAANGKKFVDHRAAFQTWCRRAAPKLNGSLSSSAAVRPQPDPVRAVLGRGVDAPPLYDLDDEGNAVARSA